MLLGVYADTTIGRITRYQSSVVSVQKLKVKLAPVGAVMFGVFQKLGNVRLAAGDSQAAGRYPQSRTGLE